MALPALRGSCSGRAWVIKTEKGFGKTKSRRSGVQPFRYFTENQLSWYLKPGDISVFCGAHRLKSRLLLRGFLFQAFGVHTTSDDSGCISRIEHFHTFPLQFKKKKKKRMIYATNPAPNLPGLPSPLIKHYSHDKPINGILTPLRLLRDYKCGFLLTLLLRNSELFFQETSLPLLLDSTEKLWPQVQVLNHKN